MFQKLSALISASPQMAFLFVVLCMSGAILAITATLWRGGGRKAQRAKWVAERVHGIHGHDTLAESRESIAKDGEKTRPEIDLLLKIADTTGFLIMSDPKNQERFKRYLTFAGFRRSYALRVFIAIKAIAMLIGGGGVFIVATDFPFAFIRNNIVFQGALAVGGMLSFGLIFEGLLKQLAHHRQSEVNRSLADALDLMIILANAGYSLDLAIARVGREMRQVAPALSEEFTITADELSVMASRRTALLNMAERSSLDEMHSLVSALVQAQKFGTPLSDALRTIANEIRTKRQLELEEKAAKLSVKITLPLMTLILPAVFIVVAAPAFIEMMKGFPL